MALTKEQFNQTGLKLFKSGDNYYLAGGTYPGASAYPRIVDSSTVSYLTNQGISPNDISGKNSDELAKSYPGIDWNTGGGNKLDLTALEGAYNTIATQAKQAEEASRVQKLNDFINQNRGTGGNVTIPKELQPDGKDEYTIFNGAFVKKDQVPELQGTTTDAQGNIIGKSIATPPTIQTLASISPAGFKTPAYKVAVPVTKDNPGGFDIYDAQGNKLTMADLEKGADGNPKVNLVNLPVQSAPTTNNNSGNSSSNAGTSSPTIFDHTQAGISDTDWNAMSPAQRSVIEGAWKVGNNQYDSGVTNVSINTKLLNDAMAAAANDPGIKAKYGDALAMDKDTIMKSLASTNQQYAQDMGLLETSQEKDRKAQAEAEAAAGRVFSGFREQAKSQLATEQGGIIASSKRDAQKNINALGQSLESKYGTAGLGQFGNLAIGDNLYNPTGNITGTVDAAKRNEILTKGTDIYNSEKLPSA